MGEIESDLSVFHRIEDPFSIGAPRFYRLVERLPLYDGAVRLTMIRWRNQYEQAQREAEQAASSMTGAQSLAAVSAAGADRFPAFEYKS